MKWEEFVKKMGNLAVIDTENLLVGKGDDNSVKVQINRWLKAGRLIQLNMHRDLKNLKLYALQK